MADFQEWLKVRSGHLFDAIKTEVDSTRVDLMFNPGGFSVEDLKAMKQNIVSQIDNFEMKLKAAETQNSVPTGSLVTPGIRDDVDFSRELDLAPDTPPIPNDALDAEVTGVLNNDESSGSHGTMLTGPSRSSIRNSTRAKNPKSAPIPPPRNQQSRSTRSAVTIAPLLTVPQARQVNPSRSRNAKVFGTEEEFTSVLNNQVFGHRMFVKYLAANGEKYFNKGNFEVIIHKNGHDFHQAVENLEKLEQIHVIQNLEGLVMKVPNLNFDNVQQFLEKGPDTYSVINSQTRIVNDMSLEILMENMNWDRQAENSVKRSRDPLNILSFEISTYSEINNEFEVPNYAKQNSMIKSLRQALDAVLAQSGSSSSLDSEGTTKRVTVEEIKEKLPKVEKYFIMSMKGCVTDVHVDFSGSNVFYHVIIGQKIFYVAPGTEENLKLYRTMIFGTDEEKEAMGLNVKWACLALKDQWTRIVVNAGETAFIPAGVIHFVHTPEKSIVFGGNYFSVDQVDVHFAFSKTEVELVENNKMEDIYSVENFYPTMAAYAKYVLLDKIKNASGEQLQKLKTTAAIFHTNLKEETAKQSEEEWKDFFAEVVTDLEKVSEISKVPDGPSSKRPAPSDEPDDAKRAKL